MEYVIGNVKIETGRAKTGGRSVMPEETGIA